MSPRRRMKMESPCIVRVKICKTRLENLLISSFKNKNALLLFKKSYLQSGIMLQENSGLQRPGMIFISEKGEHVNLSMPNIFRRPILDLLASSNIEFCNAKEFIL